MDGQEPIIIVRGLIMQNKANLPPKADGLLCGVMFGWSLFLWHNVYVAKLPCGVYDEWRIIRVA